MLWFCYWNYGLVMWSWHMLCVCPFSWEGSIIGIGSLMHVKWKTLFKTIKSISKQKMIRAWLFSVLTAHLVRNIVIQNYTTLQTNNHNFFCPYSPQNKIQNHHNMITSWSYHDNMISKIHVFHIKIIFEYTRKMIAKLQKFYI